MVAKAAAKAQTNAAQAFIFAVVVVDFSIFNFSQAERKTEERHCLLCCFFLFIPSLLKINYIFILFTHKTETKTKQTKATDGVSAKCKERKRMEENE